MITIIGAIALLMFNFVGGIVMAIGYSLVTPDAETKQEYACKMLVTLKLILAGPIGLIVYAICLGISDLVKSFINLPDR